MGDTSGNEIHVRTTNGATVSEIANEPASIRTTSMSNRKQAEVRYENGRLQVLIDGSVKVDVAVDLSALFDGSAAVVGFAAGTGLEADLHDIFNWTMINEDSPITINPNSPGSCSLKWIPLIGPIFCLLWKLLASLF